MTDRRIRAHFPRQGLMTTLVSHVLYVAQGTAVVTLQLQLLSRNQHGAVLQA